MSFHYSISRRNAPYANIMIGQNGDGKSYSFRVLSTLLDYLKEPSGKNALNYLI